MTCVKSLAHRSQRHFLTGRGAEMVKLALERLTSTLGAFESPTQEIVLRHRWASKRTKRVKSMFMDQTAFLAERSMALAVPLHLKWTCKDKAMCYRELAMLRVTVLCKSKVLTVLSILQVNVHPVLTHGGISAMVWEHPGQDRFSTSPWLSSVPSAPCSGAFQLFIAPLQISSLPAASLIFNFS